MKRVVITGMGTINPLASNVTDTWEAMKSGKCGIKLLDEELVAKVNVSVAGTIGDYDPNNHFDRKQQRVYDKVNQYALIAAREAALDANLAAVSNRERIGVNVSSGIGGMNTIEEEIIVAQNRGYKRVSPLFIPKAIANLVPGNIAIDLDVHGITNAIVTACASSNDAIGHAFHYISSGMVDVMLTGGSEASICPAALAGFANMKALSRSEDPNYASIPFDKNRNGFVMGEGSGVLVLEELEHAKARGAQIYGEIVGYGATCDASHITAPDSEGTYAKKAIEIALKQAQISSESLDFINAHGTSTPLNDQIEGRIFGELQAGIDVTSTKSMTGHLLGAAGAIEAINVVKSLTDGVVTATVNTQELDESTEKINVVKELTAKDSQYALSTSLGFGGHNACIIIKKWEEQ